MVWNKRGAFRGPPCQEAKRSAGQNGMGTPHDSEATQNTGVMQEMPRRPSRRSTQRGNKKTEGKSESRIRLMVSVRFGGEFSETWYGDISRRTVLTLQGSQYTDRAYQALLKAYSVRASMNGVGTWYDNAPMESFFGTLKSELVHHSVYSTRSEARTDLFSYIETFYNRRRRHSALDYLSPEAFEQLYHQPLGLA